MRWKRFVKLGTDHPYFDRKGHMLSAAEAEAILNAGYMGFDAFMENVHQRMREIDDGLREPVDPGTVMPNEEERGHGVSVSYGSARLLRNIAIAGMAVILLTVFLAFTKPGRAIAQAIYEAIVSVIDGQLSGRQSVPENGFGSIDIDGLPAEFSSIDEVKEWIPLPVAYIESEQYKIQGIQVMEADKKHVAIKSIYTDETGEAFILAQEFYVSGTSWGNMATADKEGVRQLELPGGLTVYAGMMGDRSSFAAVYMPDSAVMMRCTSLSIDEIADILEDLNFE